MKHTLFKLPGFTLVELLVVIGVLGILGSALLLTINPAGQIQKSRDAIRKSDLKQIQNALELYYQDNNGYPPDNSFLYNTSWENGTTIYMKQMPQDKNGKQYDYIPDSGGYRLYASLDRATDPQICPGAGGACAGGGNCGSGNTCNYDVTSPNLGR